ncbi:hypothetical protein BGZ76_002541 [Entomortierella beljakovae]|nr:hypothetical protein BGZ76_002541 [Entomortierella beljakovae]
MEHSNESHTQVFRSSSTSEILSIPSRFDAKSGQRIVLWRDIQQGFDNIKCIRNGGVLVVFKTDDNFEYVNPLRIDFHPGVVLDVVHGNNNNDSTVPGSSASSVALGSEFGMSPDTPASSNGGNDGNDSVSGGDNAKEDSAKEDSAEEGSIKEGSAKVDSSKDDSAKDDDSVKEAAIKEDSIKEEPNQAEDEAAIVDTNSMSQTVARLTITDNDDDTEDELQKMVMQIRARSELVISQTFELYERTGPRLFIVLPKTTRLQTSNRRPFCNQFRLYFLCECGAHTMSKKTKLQHEIHFTNHEGYGLRQPNEFFSKYGPYLLSMMQMVKYGAIGPNHVITSQSHLKLVDKLSTKHKNIELAKDNISNLVNAMIKFLQEKSSVHKFDEDGLPKVEQPDLTKAETIDAGLLRQIKPYLKGSDQDQGFGDLYRIVTKERHVKWICQDHYQEVHATSEQQQLLYVTKTNYGIFDQNEGKVTITLTSNSVAKQFYSAITKTTCVRDLDITLKWNVTLDDLRTFATAITKAKITRLSMNGGSFQSPPRDHSNNRHRYDPIMQLMSNGLLQELRLKDFDSFYFHVNLDSIKVAPRLRVLSFASDVDLKTTGAQSALSHILDSSPALVELSIETEEIHYLFDVITEKLGLLPELKVVHIHYRREDEPTLTVNFSEGKLEGATMTKYRKEDISPTDREVFETGHVTKLLWKGTPQQEDEVRLLDLLYRNPKLSEVQIECDPSRVPAITNLITSTRKGLLSRGRCSSLRKVDIVQDPVFPEDSDFVISTIEFTDSPSVIMISTDVSMQSISPRPTTDHLYIIFHQQGWSIKSLETNITFNDDLAQILDNSTQFKGSKLSNLALDTSSLSDSGLDRVDRIIGCSQELERLGLHLLGLDEELRLKKSLWLLGRHGNLLSTLTLQSKSPEVWMPYLAGILPTRDDLPMLENFKLLCYDDSPIHTTGLADKITVNRECVEWIAAMVSSKPHLLWSSTRPCTPDVFTSQQSLIAVDPPKAWTSLRSISLNGLYLQPSDWLTVIEAIDFSALESLSFLGSNFDLEQLEILVDCILDDNEVQVPLNTLKLSFTNLVDYMDDEAPWELLNELKEKAPILVIQGLERPG